MSAELCTIKGTMVYGVRDMSDDEYARAKEAAADVNTFSDTVSYFSMVEKAYEEYEDMICRHAEDFRSSGSLTLSEVREMTANSNRVLLNLLVIMVTYVEHSLAEVKREFGKGTRQARTFKKATSAVYDGVFAYRFLYRVRNYFNHISLPLKPDIHVRDAGASEPNPRLSFYFDRDELLGSSFDWPKSPKDMEEEIRAFPEKIDPEPLLAEMMECLKKLTIELLYDVYGRQTAEGALYLRDLWPSRAAADGHPCLNDPSDSKAYMMLPIWEAHLISNTVREDQT